MSDLADSQCNGHLTVNSPFESQFMFFHLDDSLFSQSVCCRPRSTESTFE